MNRFYREPQHPIFSIFIILHYKDINDIKHNKFTLQLNLTISFSLSSFYQKLYQMQLTINNLNRHSKPTQLNKLTSSKNKIDPSEQIAQNQINQRVNDYCGSPLFVNCMDVNISEDNQKNLEIEKRKIGKQRDSPQILLVQAESDNSPKRQRKQKISLSLTNKRGLEETPKKNAAVRDNSSNHSQQKKIKTDQGSQQKIKRVSASKDMAKNIKLKTQPKKQSERVQQGGRNLKDQMNGKTHTQLGSASGKKSNDSGNKTKLTLSSAFKSQLKPQEYKSQNIISSQPVVCEDSSFMTAKLVNIYEPNNELQMFPNSNIVYYNQLMANQRLWRTPNFHSYQNKPYYQCQPMKQNHRNLEQEKIQYKQASIHKQIPQQLNEKGDSQECINFKSKLRERKWIGEYAKTIKTFNQSQLRSNQLNSQAQSIVIQRGYNSNSNYTFGFTPVNRGSIKQFKNQVDPLRRGYGSVGQDLNHMANDNRYKKLASQPIQEDLYDSQNNFELKQ